MKLRDLPEWQEIRKNVEESGMDPNEIAEIGEMDRKNSLDLIDMVMALQEAFPPNENGL